MTVQWVGEAAGEAVGEAAAEAVGEAVLAAVAVAVVVDAVDAVAVVPTVDVLVAAMRPQAVTVLDLDDRTRRDNARRTHTIRRDSNNARPRETTDTFEIKCK